MLNKQILQALLTKNQNIDIKINKSEIIIFLDGKETYRINLDDDFNPSGLISTFNQSLDKEDQKFLVLMCNHIIKSFQSSNNHSKELNNNLSTNG